MISCISIYYVSAQDDGSRLRISLLTCTPGDDLYAIFGHSALRVIDSNSVTDIVYNYGTFNFEDEGFYIKFARGKLLYYISIDGFDNFQRSYQYWGREITEQVLNLHPAEKKQIREALNENLKEQNKYYKYDFFFDNCTTRLRDLINKYKKPTPVLPAVMPKNTRFREAIHVYLDQGRQHWSKLGIDILLGAPTDRIMSGSEQQFLPDNLMEAYNQATNTKVVASSAKLYSLSPTKTGASWFTPMVFFGGLLFFMLVLGLSKNSKAKTILAGLDGFLFFMTGLLGIVLVLMWTATDHSMTKDNYNLLWAWPTHTIAAFFIGKNNRFFKKYFLFTAILLMLVMIAWFFLPQQMNNALLPFVLLLIYRSTMRSFS